MTNENAASPADAVKRGGGGLIVLGIVMLVVGMLSVMAPLVTGLSIAVLVGILLCVAGITRMIWAFQAGSWGRGIFCFLLGAFTLAAGVLLLVRPLPALLTLTILLAAWFVVDGLMDIFAAFKARPARGWGWMLFAGIVSLLLGLMIWRQFPLSGTWAIGVLVGIKLIFAGWAMIGMGSAVRVLVRDAA